MVIRMWIVSLPFLKIDCPQSENNYGGYNDINASKCE